MVTILDSANTSVNSLHAQVEEDRETCRREERSHFLWVGVLKLGGDGQGLATCDPGSSSIPTSI
ncbi:hypothetical protein E2C01_008015 [Portunus trituberculatus]|uniref:Uncharacterized protein n=1 Tax=Portunus trituberculatus TaxID=210409 RepID=A0A5B7D0I2_PORTR|nr:hypothetical protein [Portunus trituberculatus]